MAAETKVVIDEYRVHPHTGRYELHLKCVTTDGNATWTGPVRPYSVCPQGLRDRFNGDLATFEAWAVAEHKSLIGAKPGVAEQLAKRKGEVIG